MSFVSKALIAIKYQVTKNKSVNGQHCQSFIFKYLSKVVFLDWTDEFLVRHYEEKARQRQAHQEEKRKVCVLANIINIL